MNPRRRFITSAAQPAEDVKTSRARPSPSAFQGLPSGASMAAMKRGWQAPVTEQASSVPVHSASKRGYVPPVSGTVVPAPDQASVPAVPATVVTALSVAPAPDPVAPPVPMSSDSTAPPASPPPAAAVGGRRRGSSANFGSAGASVSAASRRGWRPPDLAMQPVQGAMLATRRGYVPPDAESAKVLVGAVAAPDSGEAAAVSGAAAPAPDPGDVVVAPGEVVVAPVAAEPAVSVSTDIHGSRRRGRSTFPTSGNTVSAASRRGYQQPHQGSMGPSSAIAAGVKRGWRPPEESPFPAPPPSPAPSHDVAAATEARRQAYQAALERFRADALAKKQELESQRKPSLAEQIHGDAAAQAERILAQSIAARREQILAKSGVSPSVLGIASTVAEANEATEALREGLEDDADLLAPVTLTPETAGPARDVAVPASLPDDAIEEVPEDDDDLLDDVFDPERASREDLIQFLAQHGIDRLGRQHVRSVKSERLRSEIKKILAAVPGATDDASESP